MTLKVIYYGGAEHDDDGKSLMEPLSERVRPAGCTHSWWNVGGNYTCWVINKK